MTNDEIATLVVLGIILAVGVLAFLVARAARRRRLARRHPRVTMGAAQTMSAAPVPEDPAVGRPPVVLGPARPIRLEPGQLPTMIRKGLPLVIPRREDPLWQEKGWRRNGHGFEGMYRAGGRHWRGLIQAPYPGSFDAYIWQPPLVELARRTSHLPCFNLSGVDGRFKVHFHTMPTNLDHSIASIEAVLAQAMGVR